MLRAILVVLVATGCVRSDVTQCSQESDDICPAGFDCVGLKEGGFACALPGQPVCGDEVLSPANGSFPAEVCDASATASVGECSPRCTRVECGDGIRDPSEGCDDGNAISNDGCDSSCQNERPTTALSLIQSPVIGWDPAAAFDARRGVTVVFGGFGLAAASRQLFELDPSGAWRDVSLPVAPPARSRHAMAYDASLGRIVLYGGRVGTKPAADTWIWDGSVWTVRSELAPPAREEHAMAYDPRTRQIVVYGGQGTAGPLYDAWGWTVTRGWTQIDTTGVALTEPELVADPATGNLVLVGVAPNGMLHTFTWSASGWTQQPWTFETDLTEIELVADPAHGEVLLVGTTPDIGGQDATYRLTSTGWTNLRVNRLARGDVALAGTSTGAIMVGTDISAPQPVRFWTGAGWEDDRTATIEDYSSAAESDVASDIAHGRLLGFTAGGQILEVQGSRQYEATTQGNPVGGATAYRLAYHEADNTLVVVTSTGTGAVRTMVGTRSQVGDSIDWSFRPVSPATGPERVTRLVYDAARQRIVTHADKTWELVDESWREIVGDGPPPLYNHSLAYDRKRGVTVLYGGGEGGTPTSEFAGLTTDTWVLGEAGWTKENWQPAPTPRIKAGFAYDMDRQRLVLAGGFAGPGSGLYDGWELTATGWTPLDLAGTFQLESVVRTATQVTAPDGVGVVSIGQIPTSTGIAPTRSRISWISGAPQEACQRVDGDGDGLVGCEDPACWHLCSPLCRPTDTMCTEEPRCGDDEPGELEQCGVCVPDEDRCNTCGDYVCDPDEMCPGDCP